MPRPEHRRYAAEEAQNVERRLDLHHPFEVGEATVLRVVLAAGLCPDRVRLESLIDTVLIGKERRKEQHADKHEYRPDRRDQKDAITVAAKTFAKAAPCQRDRLFKFRVRLTSQVDHQEHPRSSSRDQQKNDRVTDEGLVYLVVTQKILIEPTPRVG